MKSRASLVFAALLALGLAAAPLAAQAAWTHDPAVNTSFSAGPDVERDPQILPDGTGGYFASWFEYVPSNTLDYPQIVRISAAGEKLWQRSLIRANYYFQALVPDRAGGVYWVGTLVSGSTYEIQVYRYDADGNMVWTLAPVVTGYRLVRVVADSDPAGGLFLAFEWILGGNGTDIYAKYVSPSGSFSPAGMGNAWPCGAVTGEQLHPTVAAIAPGRAVVAWDDQRNGAANADIYWQLLSTGPNWTPGGHAISALPVDERSPKAVATPGGAFLVWYESVTGPPAETNIQYGRFSTDGSTFTPGGALTSLPADQFEPEICGDTQGGAYVTWTDRRFGGSSVFAQRLTPAGTPAWPMDGVPVSAPGTATWWPHHHPAPDLGGTGAVFTWMDARRGGHTDVYAQKLDADGVAQWAAGGQLVSSAASTYTGTFDWLHDADGYPYPVIASDAQGGGTLLWRDFRNGTADIFGQRVNSCGWLGNAMPSCVNIVNLTPPPTCITPAHPCVRVPVTISRAEDTPIRAYGVNFHVTGGLALCDSQVVEGPYLKSVGTSVLFLTDHGGGSYTVDCALLGDPCGASAPAGTLFTLKFGSAVAAGTGTVVLDTVVMRSCTNAVDLASAGLPVSITIDNTAPAAIATLAAAQRRSGNDSDGTTKVDLAWSPAEAGCDVEIYRAGFGGYPFYDGAGGGEPAAPPAYPPAAPWTLAGTVASPGAAFTDETSARDFYYYVAYVVDGCGNVSAVSNRTGGTLNYFLGDVAYGPGLGDGNNRVFTEDVSMLGSHYGITLAPSDMLGFLDVGPTTDYTVDGRPVTDGKVNLEDLMMFAMNFALVGKPSAAPAAAARDALRLEAPPQDALTARLVFEGTGRLQALSLKLRWDPKVVEPASFAPGELLDAQGGVAFSPEPGALDVARLGAGRGLAGKGTLATYAFRRVGPGDPGIALASATARDTRNRDVDLGGVSGAPVAAGLRPVAPNPFHSTATLEFALPTRGTASLSIYSVDGRRVRVVTDGAFDAGTHRVTWDGRDAGGARVAPGVYFARLVTPQGIFTRSVACVR